MHSLQIRLAESEAAISRLKGELEARVSPPADAAISIESAEGVRAEFTAMIDKLTSEHAEQLKTLQTQLTYSSHQKETLEVKRSKESEATESHKAEVESLNKELLEQKSTIASCMEEIALHKEAVQKQKADSDDATKAAQEKSAGPIDNLERELQRRDQVIANLNAEMQSLSKSNWQPPSEAEESEKRTISALEEKISSLEAKFNQAEADALQEKRNGAGKDAEIEGLRNAVEKLQVHLKDAEDAKSIHEDGVAKLKADHEAYIVSIRSSHANEISAAKESAQSDRSAANVELQSFKEKLDAAENALRRSQRSVTESAESARIDAAYEIDSLKQKVDALEEQLSAGRVGIHALQTEIHEKIQEANAIHEKCSFFEDHAGKLMERADSVKKSHEADAASEDHHARVLEDMKLAHVKQLDQLKSVHGGQLKDLESEHRQVLEKALDQARNDRTQALQALRDTHSADLDKANTDASACKVALKELKQKHEGLVSAKHEQESIHAKQLELHQAEMTTLLQRHTKQIGSQNETHVGEIAELQKRFEQTKSKMKAEHEAELNSKVGQSEKEHSKAIEMLLIAHNGKLSNLQSELEASHHAKPDDLKEQLAQASKGGPIVDELNARVEELGTKLAEKERICEQVDEKAKAEIEAMRGKHSSELSNLAAENSELWAKTQVAGGKVDELERRNMTLLNQLGENDTLISATRKRVRELEVEFASLNPEKNSSVGVEGVSKSKDDTAEGEALGPQIRGTVGQPSLISVVLFRSSFVTRPKKKKKEKKKREREADPV